jgi:hypothetical protein
MEVSLRDVALRKFHPGHGNAIHRTDPQAFSASNTPAVVDHNGINPAPVGGFLKADHGAHIIGLDRIHQLDAVTGGYIHAVTTVDTPVQVDLVMEITKITALGFF